MPQQDLARLAISPQGFVFDPVTGGTFTLNGTGRAIVEAVRDGSSLDDIVQRIDTDFEATGADLERDVLEFVRVLREAGLLPASFELA
ncbi:MAG: hypothetical protein ACI8PZ_004346 [Myxococcota bacterium]|jgi:hypothetical protein